MYCIGMERENQRRLYFKAFVFSIKLEASSSSEREILEKRRVHENDVNLERQLTEMGEEGAEVSSCP